MSWFSHFIFDPIKAAAARATTSTNPVARATGAAAQDAISHVAQDASMTSLSHNSAVGVANTVVGDLESGLKGVVDSFVYALVAQGAGMVPGGALLAPVLGADAVAAANVGLDFAEQHAMTYLSALFSHHRTGLQTATSAPAGVAAPNAPTPPVTAPAEVHVDPQPQPVG